MIEKIKELMKNADAAIILTGAGMGADSGLATFRDPNNGFWTHYPALKDASLNFHKIANPAAFESNPELALAFYGHRHQLYENTTPHDGYRKLNEWVKTLKLGAFFVTTNVDGHHYKDLEGSERESFPILEEHGNINDWICSSYSCGSRNNGPLSKPYFTIDEEKFVARFDSNVNCRVCGSILRPNIMMFEDCSFNYSQFAAQRAKYDQFVGSLLERRRFPNVVVIVIGAGNAIPTMQSKMMDLGRYGFTTVSINPDKGLVLPNYWIKGGALESLTELLYEF